MRAATEAITYDRSLEKYKGSSPGAMPGARLRLAYALIPVFLALAATFNTLNNGFAFDDEWMILRNPFVHSLRNLPLVLTTNPWTSTEESSVSAFPYFRPVLAGLLVVSYRIFGATAWGYHLVNILIHVGVTLLVFIVVKEITGRLAGAAVCSALFAVHPVHAEAVAWISGVPEPLMAIFALPSFWFYLNYRKTGRKLSIAASAVFFLLALMSKETALALPLIVAYCELAWPGDSAPLKKRILQSLALAGLYAMPAAAYFGLRYYVNGSLFLTYEPHFGWQHTLLSMPLAAIKYLALLLLPAGYKIHHYTEPVESIESIAFIGPLLVIIAVALAVRFARVRAISLSAAWLSLWMALPLAAIGAFLPVYFVQERYLYIASMGFCLAVAIGIERLAGRGRAGRVA
ncbi:MAG TPA: hypothetical protein VNO14_15995, partial [Blastocatellia bacterium]|nr:hypothetical protein [Blastocatellia bacterium]